jgi:hypothetical protein
MKLTEHIAKMQTVLKELGDIDMVCLGFDRGPPSWVAMRDRHIAVVTIDNYPPSGVMVPYVQLGGLHLRYAQQTE